MPGALAARAAVALYVTILTTEAPVALALRLVGVDALLARDQLSGVEGGVARDIITQRAQAPACAGHAKQVRALHAAVLATVQRVAQAGRVRLANAVPVARHQRAARALNFAFSAAPAPETRACAVDLAVAMVVAW